MQADVDLYGDLVGVLGVQWDVADAKMAEAGAVAARGPGLCSQMVHFYEIYAERVTEYRQNPPGPGWDAVYVATSK